MGELRALAERLEWCGQRAFDDHGVTVSLCKGSRSPTTIRRKPEV
jgi:hypothetical protein